MIRKLSQPNANQTVVTTDNSPLDLSFNIDTPSNTVLNPVDIPPVDLKIPAKTILNNADLSKLKGFSAVKKK